jgi:hypothetical protein
MVAIASSPDQITPQWLTQALHESGFLPTGEVTAVQHTVIGTGKMGDNLRFQLHYDGAYDAPPTLIAKLPATDDTARTMAGTLRLYYKEVMFYKHLAAGTAMRTPLIYTSEINDEGSEFVTLMEDLAPAQPGNQLVGESLPHTRMALEQAALLAAAYYGNEEVGKLDYVSSQADTDDTAKNALYMQQFWPQFVDRFGHGIPEPCNAFAEHYVDRCAHSVSRFQGKKTLIHGDFRSENLLFGAAAATVVDWQTVAESSALADAAYFLGGSVDTEQRRQWERPLISDYCQWLNAAGVSLSERDCWEQYREHTMHGIMLTVLGAVFSAADPRSDKMFLTMIQRHLQHCVDLNAIEFLD